MIDSYVPVLILLAISAAQAIGMPLLSHLVSPQRPTSIKGTPYESGMPAIGTAHERFSVKFYLVAILFIFFDIETVFFIPWAVHFRKLGLLGLIEMVVFIVILSVGFIYAWKRKALEWN